jgi:hypothetical protein
LCLGIPSDFSDPPTGFLLPADDLNAGFRSWLHLVSDESAVIFSRTSRNRAVRACCTAEGTATAGFSGPPINRAARVRVDPIHPSSSSRRSHFRRRIVPAILRPSCSRAHSHSTPSSGQPRACTTAPRRVHACQNSLHHLIQRKP